MRINKSLRLELGIVILGSALLLVGVYTALLPFYLQTGLRSAAELLSNIEAEKYDNALKTDPQAPLPITLHGQAYVGEMAVPRWIRELTSLAELPDRELVLEEIRNDQSNLLILPYELHSGERLYLIREVSHDQIERLGFDLEVFFDLPLVVGILFIAILLGATFLLNKRIAVRMNALASWADSLTLENQSDPKPDFKFSELNRIAGQLQDAFKRIGEVLAREQQFLRFASHELRTPLSIIRSNIDLLDKQNAPDVTGAPAFARIRRSALSMQHLIETLLWLSRGDDSSLEAETFDLALLIKELAADHRYLLEGKEVEIQFDPRPTLVTATRTPCAIAIANLIRNAFQHTNGGTVTIVASPRAFNIRNWENGHATGTGKSGDGFGLGLLLVENITDRMGWRYSAETFPGGRDVTLFFDTQLTVTEDPEKGAETRFA